MGLIGAMIALSLHHRSSQTAAIRGAYIRWVIYMLIFGLLPGVQIDNAAHVGGLAGGFALAYVAGLPKWEGSWTERLWRIAAIFCVLLTAVAFLEMYLWLNRSGALSGV
jgi:rhomboid protease GluP